MSEVEIVTDAQAAIEKYVRRIRAIRASVEQAHDATETDAYLARVMLVGQLQILDAVLANARDLLADEADGLK